MNADGTGAGVVTDAEHQRPGAGLVARRASSIAFILQELDKATVAVIDATGSGHAEAPDRQEALPREADLVTGRQDASPSLRHWSRSRHRIEAMTLSTGAKERPTIKHSLGTDAAGRGLRGRDPAGAPRARPIP